MASVFTDQITQYTIQLSPLEAEQELNRLSPIANPNGNIKYIVDLGNVSFPLTHEEIHELIKLPKELCIKCLMKVGEFDRSSAEFLITTFNASKNQDNSVSE